MAGYYLDSIVLKHIPYILLTLSRLLLFYFENQTVLITTAVAL